MTVRLALLLLLPVAGSGAPAGDPSSAWPEGPAELGLLADEAWRGNLALAGAGLEVERAEAALAEARSHFLPRVDFLARYSVADGGRTIDFPTGDLLNGVYATLNQYLAAQGQPARFPVLANQSIALLRRHEQETKLRVTQPVYAPEIAREVAAARAGRAARAAQFAAYRRQLRAEVQEARLQLVAAEAAVSIYASARDLVRESLRVNRSLAAQDKVTADVVLRAEAEAADVDQRLAEAAQRRDLARRYVNFLLNRPLETELAGLPEPELARWADALATTRLPELAPARREELAALDDATAAAHAHTAATSARRGPTVGLAVEGGIQGETYQTGARDRYALGSVVLEWNVFDGDQRRQATARARIDERDAARRRAETERQLELQVRAAESEFTVAREGLEAARLRVEAARADYRIVARREAEGMANPLTVLDARNTLTGAELNFTVTRTQLLVAAVRLDRAAALTSLP